VKLSCLLPACLVLGFVIVGSRGEPPAPAKTDLTQPQSPSLPVPQWLKVIDQGAADPRLKGYLAPEGVKVEIVAEAPVVVNPVGMAFGDDGTPYVLEWRPSPGDERSEKVETFTYKDGSTRKVPTATKRVKDVVKTLRSTRGDGRWDQAQVVLEDELPSSILLHDGWIYLTGRGTVRRFKQSKPGGPYDVKEVIARGFGGFGHRQVSGLTLGNDGWLYVSCGAGDNVVEGSDGSRATVLRSGAIFRCRPDGSRLHTYALGFCNPYRDVAFDAEGNPFHADNDHADGSKWTGCRLLHVAEGSDFGWRLRAGVRGGAPDPVRAAVGGELPGKMPPLLRTGRGAPAGLFVYDDTRFPENFRGLLYYPDVVRQLVRAYRVEPRGATFAVVEEFEFLKSADPLFRPCQMTIGPDGATYVVDWRTDSGGAGRLWGDGQHGRIYRLTWAGTTEQPALAPRPMDSWQKVVKMKTADLLETLAGDEAGERTRAQRELVRRGEEVRKPLLQVLASASQPEAARIAALGALQSFWNADVQEAFQETLRSGEPALRRLAAEGLGLNAPTGSRAAHAVLLEALSDQDPAVRRAVALAMGRVQAPGAADALVNLLAFDDGRDVYLRDGYLRAVESLGKPGMERLIALGETGVAKDTDRVVEAFLALRTRPAFEALPALLANPHLSAAQRASLVRSCTNYLLDPPVALEPILDFLADRAEAAAPAVQRAGLEVLTDSAALKGPKGTGWLLRLLDAKDGGVRLAAIQAIGDTRAVQAAPRLEKLSEEADRSAEERAAAAKVLHVLKEK
jgi:quinoprotein glucose dehydrogenase